MFSMIFVLLVAWHYANSARFHLFHTNQNQSCLYASRQLIGDAYSLVPYCFEESSLEINLGCHNHGFPVTFTELKAQNFSTNNLFEWQAPIDLIDAYGKFEAGHDIDGIYCYCTDDQWFGGSCHLSFLSDYEYFDNVVEEQFQSRKSYIDTKIFTFTSYTGLKCETGEFDLDWRHICNGLIDCVNGEDEINCHLLESNECNLDFEFRCKSGMCIEKSFAYDFMYDCLDRSDEEQLMSTIDCYRSPSINCEEFHCASMNYQYPCGDGECVSNGIGEISNSKTCSNGRNRQFFSINNTEDFCQACFLCFVTINNSPLSGPVNQTSKECYIILANISCSIHCQNVFLTNFSLMYPDVRLFYTNKERKFPQLICYNNSKCDLFPTSINQSGLTCQYTEELISTQSFLSFADFFSGIHRLFSSCKLPSNENLSNSQRLFSCPNSHRSISLYRLNDHINDCFLTNADEKFHNICSLNLSNHFQCLTSNDCVLRSTLYNPDHVQNIYCKDQSDRIFPLICQHRDDFGCRHRRGFEISMDYFLFQELCNNQVHPNLIDDEKDCDEWKRVCNRKYRQCDGVINCFDQQDELNCDKSQCRINEKPTDCFRYPNPCVNKIKCLPIALINDGKIDCFGSVDEEIDYCARNYPNHATTRFHCLNHSKCIPLEDLCDGIIDCPYEDDEILCPNRVKNSQCPPGTYFCNPRLQRPSCAGKNIRCDGAITCPDYYSGIDYNDESFCYLIAKPIHYKISSLNEYNQYPPVAIVTHTNDQQNRVSRSISSSSILDIYHCHRGIIIKSLIDDYQCLCPPSYYGKRCEYQSERISVILHIQVIDDYRFPQMVYKFLIRLQTFSNMFFDHIELYHSTSFNKSLIYKQVVYLRSPPLYERYSVVIDIFKVTTISVDYHSSFYYNISFPFLPVNRLAVKVIIDNELRPTTRCKTNCSAKGQCLVYSNNINENFCLCQPGWTGQFCQIKQQMNCSPTSLSFHSQCICPLTFFGQYCYAHSDICRSQSICQNNGTCISLDIRSFQFVCVCPPMFYGSYCQYLSARVNINIKNMWPEDRSKIRASIVIIHLASISNKIGLITTYHRHVFKNVDLDSHVISYIKKSMLPTCIFVQVYFDTESESDYYLVAFLKYQVHTVKTSVLSSNRCPRVNTFLNSSLMSLSYMQRIKHYYRPCLVLDTRCFYDEFYICLCDNNGFLDCFKFDHLASNCSTNDQLCLNNGQCYQSTQTSDKFEFACVCPRCYFGDQCQFTMIKYTISLDAILTEEIQVGRTLSEQYPVIRLIIALSICVVIIGFIMNGLSILTFSQNKSRQVGCGWYLLIGSIVSQLGILVFGARIFYLYQTRTGQLGVNNQSFVSFSCISLEFLLSILPSINDWLTACVSVERTLVSIKGVKFNRRKSVFYAKFVIIGVIGLNIVSVLHEPFYRRLVFNTQDGKDVSWCVIEFPHTWINTYEIITNMFHLIGPFAINFISIFVFLIDLVRRKVLLSTRKSFIQILIEQLSFYKVFLISPFILILLGLPRLIFSFAFSCVQIQWQKQLFLTSYFISILPMMSILIIFILPKQSYKNELIKSITRIKQSIQCCSGC